ncbi:hypothetical protein [Streptomyces sp. NPDC017988]|uniref:hypothetical protein n=1 Tax=Streptomyces sp. NPDC017988 TaxID=3365025 RepID=UPI003794250E
MPGFDGLWKSSMSPGFNWLLPISTPYAARLPVHWLLPRPHAIETKPEQALR